MLASRLRTPASIIDELHKREREMQFLMYANAGATALNVAIGLWNVFNSHFWWAPWISVFAGTCSGYCFGSTRGNLRRVRAELRRWYELAEMELLIAGLRRQP